MKKRNIGLFCSLLLQCVRFSTQTASEEHPPEVIQHPPRIVVFEEGQRVELPCVGRATPAPVYEWKKNGKAFDLSVVEGTVTSKPGEGTLVFSQMQKRDEGAYQCFIKNKFGVAMSDKAQVTAAYIGSFTSENVRVYRVPLGHPVTLKCIPPRSFPPPSLYWATSTEVTEDKFTPIKPSQRVIEGVEGNLHFTNVVPSDHKNGSTYMCMVYNQVLKRLEKGSFHKIQVLGAIGTPIKPMLMWRSPTYQLVTLGNTVRLLCIFSGNPAPTVTWSRLNAQMPTRAKQLSYGRKLVIENVQTTDAGSYECYSSSDDSGARIMSTFTVRVQEPPKWSKEPNNKVVTAGKNVSFECEASGNPKPTLLWYRNGKSLGQSPVTKHVIVEKNKVTFLNVTSLDNQVLMCNASSRAGYTFKNFYLKVQDSP